MKDAEISKIKGIAIFGVILHHTANRRLAADTNILLQAAMPLFGWCVMVFLAISGWLHAASRQKKTVSDVKYLADRARRLLVPFVLLNLVYVCFWQALQMCGFSLRDSIPVGFIDKIGASFWPIGGQAAEQLYFLLLLFGVSQIVQGLLWFDRRAGFLAILAFGVGLIFFPASPSVGFHLGVGVWGLFAYAAGFWLFQASARMLGGVVLLGLVILVLGFHSPTGMAAVTAVLLLWSKGFWSRWEFGLLTKVGEASGTIFIYHTPILLLPLIILGAHLSAVSSQFVFVVLACVTVALFLTWSHGYLKNTRFKFLLM